MSAPVPGEDHPRTGVLLCGHGSRAASAVEEFAALARALPAHLPPDWPVEHGYLEFADPVIGVALDRLRERGCERVLAVPGMLFAATHAKNDIPSVLNAYAARHGIEIRMGRELGLDARLLRAAGDRAREAVARADAEDGPVALHDTCLVVIGRGASDPDANARIAHAARMLWEGMGFGWGMVGYSGVTFPLVEPCLEHATRLGYARVVVLPWFLFSGILIDRIRGFTRRAAEAHPGVRFVDAGYLGAHPEVVATFAERATEQLGEVPPPNCALCKYRTAVLGFEAEVGAPQESHHHHVEGQGAQAPGSNVAACALCDDFCTGLCRLEAQERSHGHAHAGDQGHARGHAHGPHGHGHPHDHGHEHEHGHGSHDHHAHAHGPHAHHHAPYPHADHPLGPESVRRSKAPARG